MRGIHVRPADEKCHEDIDGIPGVVRLETEGLHASHIFRCNSLHFHSNQVIGVGLKTQPAHVVHILGSDSLNLHPDKIFGVGFEAQSAHFVRVFTTSGEWLVAEDLRGRR